MQGVHESKGVTGDYLRLEVLIQKVVSPYLGTHGLYSRDGSSSLHCSSCVLGMSEVMFDGRAFRRALRFGVFWWFSTQSHQILPEKRLQRSWTSKSGSSPVPKNPVVRSKSYNVPMLTPVAESDGDPSAAGNASIRRHSVSEMTSCLEESVSVAESATANDTSTSSLTDHSPASTASAALSGTPTLPRQKYLQDFKRLSCPDWSMLHRSM